MIQSGGRSTGSRPQTPRERRSEKRRGGEEGRFRGAPYHLKKKKVEYRRGLSVRTQQEATLQPKAAGQHAGQSVADRRLCARPRDIRTWRRVLRLSVGINHDRR